MSTVLKIIVGFLTFIVVAFVLFLLYIGFQTGVSTHRANEFQLQALKERACIFVNVHLRESRKLRGEYPETPPQAMVEKESTYTPKYTKTGPDSFRYTFELDDGKSFTLTEDAMFPNSGSAGSKCENWVAQQQNT